MPRDHRVIAPGSDLMGVANDDDIDQIFEIIGISRTSRHMGAFAGSILPNNLSIRDLMVATENYADSRRSFIPASVLRSQVNIIQPKKGHGSFYQLAVDQLSDGTDMIVNVDVSSLAPGDRYRIYNVIELTGEGAAKSNRKIIVNHGDKDYNRTGLSSYELESNMAWVEAVWLGETFGLSYGNTGLSGIDVATGAVIGTLAVNRNATDLLIDLTSSGAITDATVEIREFPIYTPSASGGVSPTVDATIPIASVSRTITIQAADLATAPTVTDTAGTVTALASGTTMASFGIDKSSIAGHYHVHYSWIHAGGTSEKINTQ